MRQLRIELSDEEYEKLDNVAKELNISKRGLVRLIVATVVSHRELLQKVLQYAVGVRGGN